MTLAIGLYIACELIANVTSVKPLALGRLGVIVPAGVFIYALTFTLLDLIHERLGKRGARQVIGTAFAANLLLAGYAQLTVSWPAPAFFDGQAAVERVLGSAPRIVGTLSHSDAVAEIQTVKGEGVYTAGRMAAHGVARSYATPSRNSVASSNAPAGELQADRQPVRREAAGHADGRQSGQVAR